MAEISDVLARSLNKRLDYLAGVAHATEGTFEFIADEDDYVAMILPRSGAAIVGRGRNCTQASLALLKEIETRLRGET